MMLRGTDTRTMRPVVGLSPTIDGGSESIIYADTGEPVMVPYFAYYDAAFKLVPDVRRTLLIGGGAFGYPRHQLADYPASRTDVVEIDPKLVDVSRSSFFLKDDPRLRIILEDGRTYLDRADGPYDVVMLDAFKSKGSVPYQLTTRESMRHCYDLLDGHGILAMNLLTSIRGTDSKFLTAEVATVKTVFPRVEVYAVQDPGSAGERQNLSIIASKDPALDLRSAIERVAPDLASHRLDFEIPPETRILTDDYAPVDQYLVGL